ncbi:hypothetical protein BZL30_3441 [Mycobacterium kansasii]|uniref:Uncharacterized protein n=1 Tax=Mycobacterium kansasii TaxID=1768 RepID=A0A1V3XAR9_MYCKA|nr:hypothetical protein BZL30_3441 [Mycobacterium kansasii]
MPMNTRANTAIVARLDGAGDVLITGPRCGPWPPTTTGS